MKITTYEVFDILLLENGGIKYIKAECDNRLEVEAVKAEFIKRGFNTPVTKSITVKYE